MVVWMSYGPEQQKKNDSAYEGREDDSREERWNGSNSLPDFGLPAQEFKKW
jgi:hypothetical protein